MNRIYLFIFLFFILEAFHCKSFSYNETDFLLNGYPFHIYSGELHYPRIPPEYWRHRIRMAKSMGLNTISSYVFWNFHEEKEGSFDFSSQKKDLRKFISIVQEEGMYMLIRPGPYVCGEWDGGGLPFWLRNYNMKLRCKDWLYLHKVKRYIKKVAKLISDLQITRGGPILMLQIENEYGSYGNDQEYLHFLESLWRENGINIPFYTADGAWTVPWATALKAATLPHAVIGIDPGVTDESWNEAKVFAELRKVPVLSSETYPGWMTHWGESYKGKETVDVLKELEYLFKRGSSFSLYMIHGGTNFAFTAGANYDDVAGFQATITSYDYDAPINEQGAATNKFKEIKKLFEKYSPENATIGMEIPEGFPVITFEETKMKVFASIWENLKEKFIEPEPRPMEYFNQFSGVIIYKTKLTSPKSGLLKIADLHDIGNIFVDEEYVGSIDRTNQTSKSIVLDNKNNSLLEILTFAMGRVNFGMEMLDNKGITDYVSLSGLRLLEWEIFPLDLSENYILGLIPLQDPKNRQKKGLFFKASFNVTIVGDTYIDLKAFKIGVVWVNGNNLGRFWSSKGPQERLFCPGSFLKKGNNEIVVFDLEETEEKNIKGVCCLRD